MSSIRAFLRDVAAACQPRELVEAHREIDRMNKRYADMVVRLARAQVTINQVRQACDDIDREAHQLYGDGDKPSNVLGRANGLLQAANRVRTALNQTTRNEAEQP